jgi:hypothetical protein
LRATERLRAQEGINEAARDIRTLSAARNYLSSLARRFPEQNKVNFNIFIVLDVELWGVIIHRHNSCGQLAGRDDLAAFSDLSYNAQRKNAV